MSNVLVAQGSAGKRILHYQPKDGLSFGVVTSITQDEDGFLWIGTTDGLNRFDGVTFKVYKSDVSNPTALASNYINTLHTDDQGTLWVASKGGLQYYDQNQDRFIHYTVARIGGGRKSVRFTIADKGNLWVETGSEFGYVDTRSRNCKLYNRSNLPALSGNFISTVFQDSQNWLWVGTRDKGVNLFRVRSGKIVAKEKLHSSLLSSITPNTICEDHYGNIWIATSNGLVLYKRNEAKAYMLPSLSHKLRSNFFESLLEVDNRLLIGLQDGGLYKLDLSQTQRLKPEDFVFEAVKGRDEYNITYNSVRTIFRDSDKNVWIGTHGDGLYLMGEAQEQFIRHENIKKDKWGGSYVRYYGMCQDKAGNLWLGTDGDGIYKTTPEGRILKHYKSDGSPGSIRDNAILTALCDRRGNLWFGTYSQGLFLYHPESDTFEQFILSGSGANSIGGRDVRAIFEDSEGKLWIGIRGDGGLIYLDPVSRKFTSYNTNTSGLKSSVGSIAEAPDGSIYIGTYGNGLVCFDRRLQKFYPVFPSPETKRKTIRSLIINQGWLFIGTEGYGMLIYDLRSKKLLKSFNEKNGLANNTINAIRVENKNVVWMSTNRGLTRIDLSNSNIWNFDESEGLQTGEFNMGSVVYNAEKGYMCFGGPHGWNFFYPSKIRKSIYKPKVLLTGLQLFQPAQRTEQDDSTGFSIKNISHGSKIKLPYDQAVFAIHYAALNFLYPQKGEYAYTLEGLDKTWNYVKDQRSAIYRYLSPGTYKFKVKASNQDGIWSDDFAEITIKILPPWYLSWWAYFLYASFLGTAIYFYLSYRREQNRLKYEVKMAHMAAEKEKESNERKLSFFTHISHEFRTPLTLIINPIKDILNSAERNKDLSSLNIVHRNARRLLSLVDQLLLFRKSENGEDELKLVKLNVVEFCNEVFLCFTHQAKAKAITFLFESESEEIEVFADREKMEIILFNLLSNAFKFTPNGGHISLKIIEHESEIEIHVEDTGRGISPETGQRLFEKFYQPDRNSVTISGFGIGLFLVKKFTEAHQGSITYTSELDTGTDFCLLLKKGRSHFPNKYIIEEISEKSTFLDELIEEPEEFFGELPVAQEPMVIEKPSILLIDDNLEIRKYIKDILGDSYLISEAGDGTSGLELIKKYCPDLVITDIIMPGLSGVELCQAVKEDPALNHILIILLTSSSAAEVKLKGIETGADDYITKPFDRDLFKARVASILKSRYNLQQHFFNAITLKNSGLSITGEDKEFLEKCIKIVEEELDNLDFSIKILADKTKMSHSSLYRKVKAITGKSLNEFLRIVKLRKAAEMFIYSNCNVNEVAVRTGFNDVKNFRDQFYRLFEMNPSEYIKKYRKPFNNTRRLHSDMTREA